MSSLYTVAARSADFFTIRPLLNLLQFVSHELPQNQDITNALLFWNETKGNANHDHRRRRQGFDAFVDHQSGSGWTTSAHLGLHQKGSRPPNYSQVEIGAITRVTPSRDAILSGEGVKHCPRLDFCSSNKQDITTKISYSLFRCFFRLHT